MTEVKYITVPVRITDGADEVIAEELRDALELFIQNDPLFSSIVLDAVRRQPEIQIESKVL